MSDEEILDVCFLFIMAGLDTVTASLGCSMAYLAQHPEQQSVLCDVVDDEHPRPIRRPLGRATLDARKPHALGHVFPRGLVRPAKPLSADELNHP